ncbi:MAG TPA: hypothetical protein VIU45_00135 [Chitinophagaceae bacterium]
MNNLTNRYTPGLPAANLKHGKELLRQQVTLLNALHSIQKRNDNQFNKNELIRNNHKLKQHLQYLNALLQQLT